MVFSYKNNDISGTHARGLVGMFPQNIFEKKCNLVRFDVSLHTILGPPRQVPSDAICGPTQVRFLASYHTIWGLPQISFFA